MRRRYGGRWRRWAGLVRPSPNSTAALAWVTRASACWQKNSVACWRRCRSHHPSISPPRPLLLAGTDAQKRRLLPKLAEGSAIGCFALAEGTGNPDPTNVRARATGGRLAGSKWPVMDGNVADFAIVVARDEAGEIALFLADLGTVTRREPRHRRSQPQSRAHRLRWRGGGTARGHRRAGRWCSACSSGQRSWWRSNRSAAPMPRSRWHATMRWSAMRSGGRSARSRRSSTSSPTCMSRTNWRGRMRITVRGRCRRMPPNCRWRPQPRGCRRPRRSIWHPRRTSRRMAAIGFTWDVDCHLYYRRSKQLALALGAAPWWKHRLVELIEMRNAA